MNRAQKLIKSIREMYSGISGEEEEWDILQLQDLVIKACREYGFDNPAISKSYPDTLKFQSQYESSGNPRNDMNFMRGIVLGIAKSIQGLKRVSEDHPYSDTDFMMFGGKVFGTHIEFVADMRIEDTACVIDLKFMIFI